MNRRRFLSLATTAGLVNSGSSASGAANPPSRTVEQDEDDDAIDPYFLESGDVTPREQQDIERYIDLQQQLSEGVPVRMRGKPKRAPTYRFLYWQGELGDPDAKFVGPLSLRPALEESEYGFQVNAQLMNFHPSSEDWSGKKEQGLMTIELRAQVEGEPMTWLYAQQLEIFEGGISTLGSEYIAQREGVPVPLITDQPNIDLRIQLIRNRKKGKVLKNIFRVASFAAGVTTGGAGPIAGMAASSLTDLFPSVQVPQLVREGVALSQAVFGDSAQGQPIWRSGFTSYGIASGGSRLRLQPGFWVAMDGSREVDLRTVRLDVDGDRPGLFRGENPLDINYMVLSVELTTV